MTLNVCIQVCKYKFKLQVCYKIKFNKTDLFYFIKKSSNDFIRNNKVSTNWNKNKIYELTWNLDIFVKTWMISLVCLWINFTENEFIIIWFIFKY